MWTLLETPEWTIQFQYATLLVLEINTEIDFSDGKHNIKCYQDLGLKPNKRYSMSREFGFG